MSIWAVSCSTDQNGYAQLTYIGGAKLASDGVFARWLNAREKTPLMVFEITGGGYPPAMGLGWGVIYWLGLRGFVARDAVGVYQLTKRGRQRLKELSPKPDPVTQALNEEYMRIVGRDRKDR